MTDYPRDFPIGTIVVYGRYERYLVKTPQGWYFLTPEGIFPTGSPVEANPSYFKIIYDPSERVNDE